MTEIEPTKVNAHKRTFWEWLQALSPNMKAAIFTVIVTMILAIFGAFYTLGYNMGAKDLETVNDFKKLDLPKLIGDLQALTTNLRARSDLETANKRLANEAAEKKAEIKRLESDLDGAHGETTTLKKQVTELQARISSLVPTSKTQVTVKEYEAKDVHGNINIGVAGYFSGFLNTRINGETTNMSVGDHYVVYVADLKCTVVLMKIGDHQGDYEVWCNKN
jgi:hypothetical protein